MIKIVDAGIGNIGAIVNMLRHLRVPAESVGSAGDLENATGIILPGVGAFDHGRKMLDQRGFTSVLQEMVVHRGVPVLGICLGMQLMTKGSEEGCMPGLGWIEGSAARFDVEPSPGQRLKVPHMGWDEIQIVRRESIFREWMGEARFYFVHSYRVTCSDEKDIVALGRHGHDFVAVFQRDNIVGVQFHPEKSHRFGMQLFQRFAAGIQ